jgi:hypothetical protein
MTLIKITNGMVAIAIPLAQGIAQGIASNPAVIGLAAVTIGYAIDQIQRAASKINIDVSGIAEALDYLQNSRYKAYEAGVVLRSGLQQQVYRYEDHPLSPRRRGITPHELLRDFPKDKWDSADPKIPPFPDQPNLDVSVKPHGNPQVDTRLPPFPNIPSDEFRQRPTPSEGLPPLQVLEFRVNPKAKSQIVPAKGLRDKAKKQETTGASIPVILARQLILAPSASMVLALSPNNFPFDPKRLFPLGLNRPIPELQKEVKQEFSRRPSITPNAGVRQVPIPPNPQFPNMPTNPNKSYIATFITKSLRLWDGVVWTSRVAFIYYPADPPVFFQEIRGDSLFVGLRGGRNNTEVGALFHPDYYQFLEARVEVNGETTDEDFPTVNIPNPQLGNPELLFPPNNNLPNFEEFEPLTNLPNLNLFSTGSNSASSISSQLLQSGFKLSLFPFSTTNQLSQTLTPPTTNQLSQTPTLPTINPLPQIPTSPNLQLPQLLPPARSIPTNPILSTTSSPPALNTKREPFSDISPLNRNNLSRIAQAVKQQLSCKRRTKPDDCPTIGDVWDKLTSEDNSFNFVPISVTYKICDAEGNETVQTEIIQIPANSKGSLESLTRALFRAINSLHDCPSEAILALPEWYQQKEKGAIPQAAVLLHDPVNKSYWTFHIPHYNMPKDFTPTLPSFVKGSFYGKLKLKDGSRVLIYAKDKTEVQKVINAVIPLINPLMLTSPLNVTYGEKQGALLKEVEVKPTRIMYYSQGLKDTKPDWIIYLD